MRLRDLPLYCFSTILWGLWWLLAIVLTSLAIVISLITASRIDNHIVTFTCRLLTYSVFIFPQQSGVRPDELPFPVIYVGNHVSFFELFICGFMLPGNPRGMEIASHFAKPFYGWFLRRFGQISLKIGSLSGVREAFREAERVLAAKERSILIMPEGTRTRDGTLLQFRRGAFHLSFRTGVPIVPLVFKGLFKRNNRNSRIIRPGRFELFILPPLYPEKFADADEMKRAARQMIEAELSRPYS